MGFADRISPASGEEPSSRRRWRRATTSGDGSLSQTPLGYCVTTGAAQLSDLAEADEEDAPGPIRLHLAATVSFVRNFPWLAACTTNWRRQHTHRRVWINFPAIVTVAHRMHVKCGTFPGQRAPSQALRVTPALWVRLQAQQEPQRSANSEGCGAVPNCCKTS